MASSLISYRHRRDHDHHHRHHGPAKPVVAPIVNHPTSTAEVHKAIHKAADVAGVSPQMAGTIAYLESKGGDSNQHNASSEGLFEMQRGTSQMVLRKYGNEIAGKLSEDNPAKYAEIIKVIQSRGSTLNLDSKGKDLAAASAYNKMIRDPYFNALLGTHLMKMNAATYGLDPKNNENLTKLYSVHLTGRLLRPSDQPLSSAMRADHIAANQQVLGGANPTVAQAYDSLTHKLHSWNEKFTAADRAQGHNTITIAKELELKRKALEAAAKAQRARARAAWLAKHHRKAHKPHHHHPAQ
jgi:hypothetical protein